ncbi:MAG: hypothetical protein WBB23_09170 [Desulforhopalus sp.]
MAARLSKISKENLLIADKIVIEEKVGFCTVRVEKGGNAAYLNGGETIMHYDTVQKARRAIKRIRPDLEPTTI